MGEPKLAIDSNLGVDDEIPTIDYLMLSSTDPAQRTYALQRLAEACDEYGFFYLVNHAVPEMVIEDVLKGIADFFDVTDEKEKRQYLKKNPTDNIIWAKNYHATENREYLKLVTHPRLHCTLAFSEVLEEYYKRLYDVKVGLARAISKIVGLEENYIEKTFKLESGFDAAVMNMYPPNQNSTSSIGFPAHTDPGFIISIIQDVSGGLQILTHHDKLINVYIPPNAFLIQLGDHLEILTNGKYKSHIHQVIVNKNEIRRISLATFHGPNLDTFVAPAEEFTDQIRPPAYRGMTYKDSLQMNGHYMVEAQSCLSQLRL